MSNNRNMSVGDFPEHVDHVNHIKCDVTDCAYHTENDACQANVIHVKPCTSASSCTSEKDTACETFREKQ